MIDERALTATPKLLRTLFRETAREHAGYRYTAVRSVRISLPTDGWEPTKPRVGRGGPMSRAELYWYFKRNGELWKFFQLYPPQ